MIQLVSEKIKLESLECLYLFLILWYCFVYFLKNKKSAIPSAPFWQINQVKYEARMIGLQLKIDVSVSISDIFPSRFQIYMWKFKIVCFSNRFCFKLKLSISYVTQLQDESRKQRKHCIWCLFYSSFFVLKCDKTPWSFWTSVVFQIFPVQWNASTSFKCLHQKVSSTYTRF